jgi:DNA-binding GntR family transcriptional regulator
LDESLESVAYREIKGRIVSADFLPGTLLSENELSAELGISRTPVHAAIARLEEEGFVTSLPKRGFLVSELSFSDFFEMHETIGALEAYALGRGASGRGGFDLPRLGEALARQVRALEDRDDLEYYKAGFDFAAGLLEAARNRSMLAILAAYRDKILCRILSYRRLHPEERPSLSKTTNERIFRAIERGDVEAARRELTANLEAIYERLLVERRI